MNAPTALGSSLMLKPIVHARMKLRIVSAAAVRGGSCSRSPFSDCVHSASNWSKLALESTIASMRTPPPQHPPPQLIPLQDRRTHAQFHRHYQRNLRPHSDF